MDRAARAAAEILDGWAPILTGLELQTGSKGVFDVSVDGETVFSKAEARRFPANGELSSLVEARLGPKLRWRSPG